MISPTVKFATNIDPLFIARASQCKTELRGTPPTGIDPSYQHNAAETSIPRFSWLQLVTTEALRTYRLCGFITY